MALFGPPFFGTPDMWLGERYEDEDMGGSYESRPKVEVAATDDETLATVIDRAADALRIHPNPAVLNQTVMSSAIGGIAFYYAPTDERAYRRDRQPYWWPMALRIPQQDGAPVEKPWQEVTVRELLAASEAGLLYGDPLRPYLYPGFPQGDIPSPDWIPPAIDAAKHAFEFSRDQVPAARRIADDVLRITGIAALVKIAWGRARHPKSRKPNGGQSRVDSDSERRDG